MADYEIERKNFLEKISELHENGLLPKSDCPDGPELITLLQSVGFALTALKIDNSNINDDETCKVTISCGTSGLKAELTAPKDVVCRCTRFMDKPVKPFDLPVEATRWQNDPEENVDKTSLAPLVLPDVSPERLSNYGEAIKVLCDEFYFPINKLLPEMIMMIMERLPVFDRLSFSMTCKKYYNIFNSMISLHEDMSIVVTQNNHHSLYDQFNSEEIKEIDHIMLPNIYLRKCKNIDLNEKFWSKYGEGVDALSFEKCKEDLIPKVICLCPNIRYLKIAKNEIVVNSCADLKYDKLTTINIQKLSDYQLNHLFCNAPLLNKIETSSEIGESSDPPKRFKTNYDDLEIPLEDLNTEKLTLNNVLLVLAVKRKQIKAFDTADLSFEALMEMSYIQDLQLEQFCSFSDINNWYLLFKTITNTWTHCLKHLDITDSFNCSNLTGFHLLVNLETIRLPTKVSDKNLEELSTLTKLENLQILCLDHPVKGFKISPVLKKFTKLRVLILSHANLINFHIFLKKTSFHLINLTLMHCFNFKMNEIFVALGQNHPGLKFLYVKPCSSLEGGDSEYRKYFKCLPQKKSMEKLENPLNGLKHLKFLYLILPNMEINFMKGLKSNLLTYLALYVDTKNGVENSDLIQLAKNCPALTSITLASNAITDEVVQHLCTLKRLRILIFLKKTRVTEVGLNHLIDSFCPFTHVNLNVSDILEARPDLAKSIQDKINRKYHVNSN